MEKCLDCPTEFATQKRNSEEKLRRELTEEQQELFRHFTEALDKHHMEEVDDALIYGFRYGISLINELKLIKM